MMLGLIRPTAGSVELFGRDPIKEGVARRSTASLALSRLRASTRTCPAARTCACSPPTTATYSARIDEMLDLVELRDRANDRVGGYSHGMRQRLGIAASLLRDPRLLLLDEPTTGLDPAGMRDMRALVRRLAREGITVLLSSHLLAEVEELCNRVAIIRTGQIVYEGSLADLLATVATELPAARDRPGARAVDRSTRASTTSPRQTASSVRRPTSKRPPRSRSLWAARIGITRSSPTQRRLEELFLG